VQWNKIALIGVGLLGGSLGLALKQKRLARTVAGYVRRTKSIGECKRAGAVDVATRDLAAAVDGAELIVLCTPIGQMRPLLEQMLPAVQRGAILTDVGSVKASVVADLEGIAARAGSYFVGSHPMAGSEKTGVSAARADLFEGAVCVVTATRKSNARAVKTVQQLWQAVGSRVLKLPPEEHDLFVSRSSHLPYIVAATLAHTVLDPESPRYQGMLCANGFRDTTRIASGSPEMWRDIALSNCKHIGRGLEMFIGQLQRMRRLIAQADKQSLEKFLLEAKSRRDKWRKFASNLSPE
jgi:prephenate dehydrogenase